MRKIRLHSIWIMFAIIFIWRVWPAVQHQFTFANDANKIGNNFTSNGVNITLNDATAYVEIPEITNGPNARSKSGMIQIDASHIASVNANLNFASWFYYIGMVVYINYASCNYKI